MVLVVLMVLVVAVISRSAFKLGDVVGVTGTATTGVGDVAPTAFASTASFFPVPGYWTESVSGVGVGVVLFDCSRASSVAAAL